MKVENFRILLTEDSIVKYGDFKLFCPQIMATLAHFLKKFAWH